MALKNCKDCGKNISTKAKACPSCGKPLRKRRTFTFFLLSILVAISVISGKNSKSDTPSGLSERSQGKSQTDLPVKLKSKAPPKSKAASEFKISQVNCGSADECIQTAVNLLQKGNGTDAISYYAEACKKGRSGACLMVGMSAAPDSPDAYEWYTRGCSIDGEKGICFKAINIDIRRGNIQQAKNIFISTCESDADGWCGRNMAPSGQSDDQIRKDMLKSLCKDGSHVACNALAAFWN